MSKGRYKTEKIYYPNRWQPTEDLIADGYYYADKKNTETIEIAAHIMAAANMNHDEKLFETGCDLMRAANSPCIFQPDYTAETATDNNNRPPKPVAPEFPDNDNKIEEEVWDDSLDDVFNIKLKPQMIKKSLEELTSTTLSEDKRRFVYYAVLVYIRWIPTPKRGSKKLFLQWWNLHFNCNWVETSTNDPFKFRVNPSLNKSQPSDWYKLEMDNAIDYFNFAKTVKDKFTQTVINNIAQDGQDFNAGPLRDRSIYLKNTNDPINSGKLSSKI